jgi:hypothetical protein
MKVLSGVTLGMALLFPVLVTSGVALADEKGKRCTKTSTSCYDTVNKKARTCITETCTFADGRTTTSVTVEMVGGAGATGGTKKPLAGQVPKAQINKAD